MKSLSIWMILLGVIMGISTLMIIGCATGGKPSFSSEKTGAQLWGDNCVRCHNAPSPSAFSDVQWETITMHMRVRANLSGEDIKKMVEFLQMAN